MQYCVVGWCRQHVSITRLAREMLLCGLRGLELMWVTGSIVLLCLPTIDVRKHTLDVGYMLDGDGCRSLKWSQYRRMRRIQLDLFHLVGKLISYEKLRVSMRKEFGERVWIR
ncbi:hypothetical protein V6N13_022947 [Hibiscus sabdariffa]|uniref:Uncharacterized protein n=1 Tax=Hibiscus sabdariffa TaxID=183260 RepID=A0ABR2BMY0_9ROSI